jgi:hypothetical protein
MAAPRKVGHLYILISALRSVVAYTLCRIYEPDLPSNSASSSLSPDAGSKQKVPQADGENKLVKKEEYDYSDEKLRFHQVMFFIFYYTRRPSQQSVVEIYG